MPCQTVTVDEPVTDESHLEITNYGISSTDPNEVSVSFTVKNVVDSGNGQTISGTASVTIDADEVDSISVSLSPSETTSESRNYTGVASGNREVCVSVREESIV